MARTVEAEAGNLGTLPGALPGADSLLGVAPAIDLLTTQGIGAQSGSPSVKDGHLDGMTETKNGGKASVKVAPSLDAGDMMEVRKSLSHLFSIDTTTQNLTFQEAQFAMRHIAILEELDQNGGIEDEPKFNAFMSDTKLMWRAAVEHELSSDARLRDLTIPDSVSTPRAPASAALAAYSNSGGYSGFKPLPTSCVDPRAASYATLAKDLDELDLISLEVRELFLGTPAAVPTGRLIAEIDEISGGGAHGTKFGSE